MLGQKPTFDHIGKVSESMVLGEFIKIFTDFKIFADIDFSQLKP
jgi:hypothetical protein